MVVLSFTIVIFSPIAGKIHQNETDGKCCWWL